MREALPSYQAFSCNTPGFSNDVKVTQTITNVSLLSTYNLKFSLSTLTHKSRHVNIGQNQIVPNGTERGYHGKNNLSHQNWSGNLGISHHRPLDRGRNTVLVTTAQSPKPTGCGLFVIPSRKPRTLCLSWFFASVQASHQFSPRH